MNNNDSNTNLNSNITLYLRRLLNNSEEEGENLSRRYEDIILEYLNLLTDTGSSSDENERNNEENLLIRNENGLSSRGTGISIYRLDMPNNNRGAILYDDLNKSIDHIYKNSDIYYSKKLEISYLSKIFNTYKYIINIIVNIYKNCIVCGDLLTDMYLLDNLINPNISINEMRGREIYFLVDNFISDDLLISTLILLSKCTLSFYFHFKDRFHLNLEIQNYDGEIFYLCLIIVKSNKLFSENFQSISPYVTNRKIELEITLEEYKKYLFLNKFEHNGLCMVKNIWRFDYTGLVFIDDKFYLDKIENTKIKYLIENKKLLYNNNIIHCPYSNIKELELLFKPDQLYKKDNLTKSRLYMFLNNVYILSYIERGWTYDDLHLKIFEENDSCYICSNNYKDYNKKDNTYIYKISLNCCKEASNGICLECFVKNAMQNYKILKSFYCCPFCKKEHIFYNKKISKMIETLEIVT